MTEQFTISRLGAQGDGIADGVNGPVYVPFALAGEVVAAEGKGASRTLNSVITQSPDRIEPVCRHFGVCGGCQLQHLGESPYIGWKKSLLVTALEREGMAAPEIDFLTFRGKRRRAVLSANRQSDGLKFGFLQRNSHELVDLTECPVVEKRIEAALGEIKQLINPVVLGRRPVQVTVLACDNGLDISVETPNNPTSDVRRKLTADFSATGFCRLVINGDLIAENARPILLAGETEITPPPGGFVQAVAEAETEMCKLIEAHLGSCKQVADLFCGMGTFALRLAKRSRVLAIEMDPRSLASLDAAWRDTGGSLKEISFEKRDLFIRPLMAAEMKKIEGVVVDPPRAGAKMQMKQIARSKVSRVALVSCNPKTFARDLGILAKAGFKLKSLTALDQFRYTPHLEVVGLLIR